MLFCAGGIATPADAALMMQLGAEGVFVGSGHLQVIRPGAPRPRDRRGDHALRGPERVAAASRELGEAMAGIEIGALEDGQAAGCCSTRGW